MRAGPVTTILRATAVAAFLVVVAACGGGGDAEPEASPGDEDLSGFTEGDFDDVDQNRVPDSEVLDPPSEVNGALTATYLVQGPDEEMVVEDLRTRLEADGWSLVEGPATEGQAVRADFVKDGRRLEVSAFPAQAFDDDYQDAVQYSLVLNQGTEDPVENTP